MAPWLVAAIQNGDVQDPSAPRRAPPPTAHEVLRSAREKHSDKRSYAGLSSTRTSTYRQVGLSRLQYGDGEYEAEVMAFQKYPESNLRSPITPDLCEITPATRTMSRAVMGSRFSSMYGDDQEDDDDEDDDDDNSPDGDGRGGDGQYDGDAMYGEYDEEEYDNNNKVAVGRNFGPRSQGRHIRRDDGTAFAKPPPYNDAAEADGELYGYLRGLPSPGGGGGGGAGCSVAPGAAAVAAAVAAAGNRAFVRLGSSLGSGGSARFRRMTSSQLPPGSSLDERDDLATSPVMRSSRSISSYRQSTGGGGAAAATAAAFGSGVSVSRGSVGRGSAAGCSDVIPSHSQDAVQQTRGLRLRSAAEVLPQLGVLAQQPRATEAPPTSPLDLQRSRRPSSLHQQLLGFFGSATEDVPGSGRGSLSGGSVTGASGSGASFTGASGSGGTPLRRQVMRRSSVILPVPQSPSAPQQQSQQAVSAVVGSPSDGGREGGMERVRQMLSDLRRLEGGRPASRSTAASPVAYPGNPSPANSSVLDSPLLRESSFQLGLAPAGPMASSPPPGGALRTRSSSNVRMLQALSALGSATPGAGSAGGEAGSTTANRQSSMSSPQQPLFAQLPATAGTAATAATGATGEAAPMSMAAFGAGAGLTVRVPSTAPYSPAGGGGGGGAAAAAAAAAASPLDSPGAARLLCMSAEEDAGGLFSPVMLQLLSSSPAIAQMRTPFSTQTSPSAASAAAGAAAAAAGPAGPGSPFVAAAHSGGNSSLSALGSSSSSPAGGLPPQPQPPQPQQPQPPSRPAGGAQLDGWPNRPTNRQSVRRMATTGSFTAGVGAGPTPAAAAAAEVTEMDGLAASPNPPPPPPPPPRAPPPPQQLFGRPSNFRSSAGGAPAVSQHKHFAAEEPAAVQAVAAEAWAPPKLVLPQGGDGDSPAPLSPLPPSPNAPLGSIGRASLRLFGRMGPRRAQSSNEL